MKLLTFLMTDPKIRKHLEGNKGLIALCELYDEFKEVDKQEHDTKSFLDTLNDIGTEKFNPYSAVLAVESQVVSYINDALDNQTNWYENALYKFSYFYDVMGEPRENLVYDLTMSELYYD